MGGDEFKAEGGGGVVKAGEFLALHFFLRFAEHLGVKGFPAFEEVPEDARQWDSLAPARSPFAASQAAQVCARAVIALGVAKRACQRR